MAKKGGLDDLEQVRGKTLAKRSALKKKFFPTAYLNDEIELIDKNLASYIQLQRQFCEYYQYQRILRKDKINEAIKDCLISDFEIENAWRVVGHKFSQDPLCTLGSIVRPPGGRFNIGCGLDGYEKFHCLYLADSVQTALFEKYHHHEVYEGENISKEFLALDINESHSNFKIKLNLDNVIDLRDDKFLKRFLQYIDDIEEPIGLNKISKASGWRESYPISSLDNLKRSLFDVNYTHSGITYGVPSNPQWLGFHCLKYGVQAIIYPSVRNKSGYNIAVFIDNITNSVSSVVELADEIKYVTESRRKIYKKNINSFKEPEVI